MDVMKLFEDKRNIEPLDQARLETMIDQALSHPQIKKPANQNAPWIRRAVSAAAVIVMLVVISMQFSPVQTKPGDTPDAFEEVTDLMMLETLSDLS